MQSLIFIILWSGCFLYVRICGVTLCCRREHETWLHSHLLLKGYHRTLARSLFLYFRFAFTWFHADVFLHFLLPLDLVVFMVLRQWSKADSWSFRVHLLVMGPVITRTQFVGRVEQEVVLLVELGDFARNAHRAELHRVHVLFVALFD